MNCTEFLELVDAFALGALTPEEMTACQEHLDQPGAHQGCVEACRRATEIAAQLASAAPPVRPAPNLWASIERELEPVATPPSRLRWSRREQVLAFVAAAAIVACAALGWFFMGERRDARSALAAEVGESLKARGASAEALADAKASETGRLACLKQVAQLNTDTALQKVAFKLLEQPTTRIVTFSSPASPAYHASAILSGDGHRAIVLSSGMTIRAGSDLELWVIRGKNAPRAAGFLHTRPDGTAAGEIDPTLLAEGAPDAFAVSIEPAGGRLTPTEVILVGAIKS